jgi:hypothetical protein
MRDVTAWQWLLVFAMVIAIGVTIGIGIANGGFAKSSDHK